MSISAVTLVSQAVKLRYPIEAVIDSVAPVADEIIVNLDIGRDDGTADYLRRLQSRFSPELTDTRLIILASRWNWDNHKAGAEFAVQSNIAVREARGDWILYVQADEVLHEADHETVLGIADQKACVAAIFERICFWRDLHTIRRDWTLPLMRMFRRGVGKVVGDSMGCALDYVKAGGHYIWSDPDCKPRLFHYSRVGEAEIIAARIQANDEMHHPAEQVARGGAYDFGLRTFDSYAEGTDPKPVEGSVLERFEGTHPEAYRRWIGLP